ncbi:MULTISPECIES: TetR/AcrR family transcriptional regulator [unclassified Nocardioides]|uniref:TetR/AcrR family transcriptional regulator n=1 Tax=unclassified Nocardioides TaxID=2615069 RepID=UPI000AD440DD|nr:MULTISPECIES: TetR/AcrR family transcriptional regulator [unclassified Nocardioides]
MSSSTATRERILEVAPEVLRRFTLAKFGMEDVARGAGIARQTVYKHFSSRDELLIAMYVREMLENQAPRMVPVVDRPPSPDNLLDVFMTELELARHYPWFDESSEQSMAPRLAEMIFRSETLMQTREAIWFPILERYEAAGVLRPDLDFAATVRWLTYQKFWLLFHPDVLCPDDEERRLYVRRFIIAGLVTTS